MTDQKDVNAAEEAREPSLSEVLQIRREKLSALQQAGRDPFRETAYPVDAYARDVNERFDEYEGKQVSIAGRILSKRGMGKAGFIDVQDHSGRIQSYVARIIWATRNTNGLKSTILAISLGFTAKYFARRKGRFQSKPTRFGCYRNPCCRCRKNGMA